MKKAVQFLFVIALCAVLAQSVFAEVVRSPKPVDTNQPGIGKYLELYHTTSDEPGSAKYYLGSGNVVHINDYLNRGYGMHATLGDRIYNQLIQERDARRKARYSQPPKKYQWGVSAPAPMPSFKRPFQPVPQNALPQQGMPLNPAAGGVPPPVPPEGMPNVY